MFRGICRRAEIVINLDPWFAETTLMTNGSAAKVALVLHHVNLDDANAKFVAQADIPVVACEEAGRFLTSVGVLKQSPLLVENGVDLELFRPLDRGQCRAEFGIEDSDFVVGYVGKASSDYGGRKGLDSLRKLITECLKESRTRFLFAGRGWEKWIGRIEGANSRIKCVGFLEERRFARFYNCVDIIASTSRIEAGPATVLEALACGTPVVATRTGIVDKVVVNDVTGWVFEREDVDGMLKKLFELEAHPDCVQSMRRECRRVIEEKWAWGTKMKPLIEAVKASSSPGQNRLSIGIYRFIAARVEQVIVNVERRFQGAL